MYPQNQYGEPLSPLPGIPAPGAPPPPRKDPVRPWLFAALGVFLVAAITLAAIILWPGDDETSSGGASSSSAAASASGSEDAAASSSSGDQFTAAPNPGADPSSTSTSPTVEPGAPGSTPPATTNGINDQQRVAACQLAVDGEGNRVSRDPQWGTASGASVEALTTLLAYLGYGVSPTDYYSSNVEQVAMSFQADYGLDADGIFGPMSWSVLHQAACG